jgi:hypothetical protein
MLTLVTASGRWFFILASVCCDRKTSQPLSALTLDWKVGIRSFGGIYGSCYFGDGMVAVGCAEME